nr:MAG TPA: hypothetical protein [Caudoviricetes sp.]
MPYLWTVCRIDHCYEFHSLQAVFRNVAISCLR